MESYSDAIQIFLSPPELEVVRRAVEKFVYIETSESGLSSRLNHAKNVIRLIDRTVPVNGAHKEEKTQVQAEMPHISYVVSRRELEEIL